MGCTIPARLKGHTGAMNRNIQDLTTATAYDRDGEKLGAVKEVYINDTTGQPDFVEVGHGLFGMSSSIVPLRGHHLDGDNLQLAFSRDRIKDAPDISDDDHLSDEDHATIYRHFGIEGVTDDTRYTPDRPEERDRDLHGDRFDRGGEFDRGRDADVVRTTTGTTGVADVPEGVDVHGFGDHRRNGDSAADRLRADSDRELGLDRTAEDRASRGTSIHGMSDEPREQYRDYETAERDYAKEARTDLDSDGDEVEPDDTDRTTDRDRTDLHTGGTRLRRYRVRPADTDQVPLERELDDPR